MCNSTTVNSIRIDCVTFDARDPDLLSGWWARLLAAEVEVDEVDVDHFWVRGAGPTLLFMQTANAKTSKNRIHLDLVAEDVSVEVDKALALGATRATGVLAGPFPWTVLHDPEGNEFCICPAQ